MHTNWSTCVVGLHSGEVMAKPSLYYGTALSPEGLPTLCRRPLGYITALTNHATLIAVGYSEGGIIVWEQCDGEEVGWRGRSMHGHSATVSCLCFVPAEPGGDAAEVRLCSGGGDNNGLVWTLHPARYGEPLHALRGHEGRIRCIEASPQVVATGSWDETVIIWSLADGAR